MRLKNRQLDVIFNSAGQLDTVKNKLTGECIGGDIPANLPTLRIGNDSPRLEILEWKFRAGGVNSDEYTLEKGYLKGFAQKHFDDSQWASFPIISSYNFGAPGYFPTVYDGYVWYRTRFTLPADWKGRPIKIVAGGQDRCAFRNQYFYVNGTHSGSTSFEGYWQEAPAIELKPNMPAYSLLEFGEENSLAIQCKDVDRCTPNLPEPDLERIVVGSFLCDQHIAAGETIEIVDEFKFDHYEEFSGEDSVAITMKFISQCERFRLHMNYSLGNSSCWLDLDIIVESLDQHEHVILEADLLDWSLGEERLTVGGQGLPCLIDQEWFFGVSHPAAIAKGEQGKLVLEVQPAAKIQPHTKWHAQRLVLGAGSFVNYLSRHGVRENDLIRLYSVYGLCEIASAKEPPRELTEEMLLENLKLLKDIKKEHGVEWDYYAIDTGWNDPNNLSQFNPQYFPEGPSKSLDLVRELKMKPILWVSPADGPRAFRQAEDEFDPDYVSCGTLHNESEAIKHSGSLCQLTKWGDYFQNTLLNLVREYGIKGFKLDGVSLCCYNPEHGHPTGKYSVHYMCDRIIDIIGELRKECPEIFIIFYYHFGSPWWLLHGSTLYERGITLEGATPSSLPAIHTRQSVTQSLDQAQHFSRHLVPRKSSDSLGVWISETRWGNWMGRDEWKDAFIMDCARGTLLFQLWGDLCLFNKEDFEFLGQISLWMTQNLNVLKSPVLEFGNVWNAGVYGYAYADKGKAIVFIHNAQFCSSSYTLNPRLFNLAKNCHFLVSEKYPQTTKSVGVVNQDSCVDIQMSPFEVVCLEITPANNHLMAPFSRKFKVTSQPVKFDYTVQSRRSIKSDDSSLITRYANCVVGRGSLADPSNNAVFSVLLKECAPLDLELELRKLVIHLAEINLYHRVIIAVRFMRDGVAWHHHGPHDLLKVHSRDASGNDQEVRLTPQRWLEQAGGWSWVLLEPCTTKSRVITIIMEAVLPETVEISLEAWQMNRAN